MATMARTTHTTNSNPPHACCLTWSGTLACNSHRASLGHGAVTTTTSGSGYLRYPSWAERSPHTSPASPPSIRNSAGFPRASSSFSSAFTSGRIASATDTFPFQFPAALSAAVCCQVSASTVMVDCAYSSWLGGGLMISTPTLTHSMRRTRTTVWCTMRRWTMRLRWLCSKYWSMMPPIPSLEESTCFWTPHARSTYENTLNICAALLPARTARAARVRRMESCGPMPASSRTLSSPMNHTTSGTSESRQTRSTTKASPT
mmetsp:Transcript_55411/g.129671  ORF Transcript_55411/g.129671 Transcript_55411/m.129671 type:complete len:260 (+) Transcript_55411:1240-2019(+)